MRFGTGVFTGTALVIHRIEWYVDTTVWGELHGDSDILYLALTNRDDLTALAANNMNVLAMKQVNPLDQGTPASFQFTWQPMESNYEALPGGGLIYPSNPLFAAVHSAGLANAATVDLVMYYTTRTLSDSDYVELVQSLIPVNI